MEYKAEEDRSDLAHSQAATRTLQQPQPKYAEGRLRVTKMDTKEKATDTKIRIEKKSKPCPVCQAKQQGVQVWMDGVAEPKAGGMFSLHGTLSSRQDQDGPRHRRMQDVHHMDSQDTAMQVLQSKKPWVFPSSAPPWWPTGSVEPPTTPRSTGARHPRTGQLWPRHYHPQSRPIQELHAYAYRPPNLAKGHNHRKTGRG